MTLTMTTASMVDGLWEKLLFKIERGTPAPGFALITREELTACVELYKTHMLPAPRDVLLERDRQVFDEKFGDDGDDTYTNYQLARAAACYVLNATYKEPSRKASARNAWSPGNWPWDRSWWKPTTRRRDLVKAAALIIAEIERLDREEARAAE